MNQSARFLLVLVVSLALVLDGNAQMDLGKLETWDNFNDVESGMITMMAPNKLMIRKFEYNGEGPAAWFMVGKEEDEYNEEFADLEGTIIPDEDGSCDRLGRYDSEDIMLTLPADMKFTDYDYISVYCIRFSHNFGYIRLRRDATFNQTVPAADTAGGTASSTPTPLDDCDQEPEPRGQNNNNNNNNNRRRRRKLLSGNKI